MNIKKEAKSIAQHVIDTNNLTTALTSDEVRLIRSSIEHHFINIHPYLRQKFPPHRLKESPKTTGE